MKQEKVLELRFLFGEQGLENFKKADLATLAEYEKYCICTIEEGNAVKIIEIIAYISEVEL